MDELSQIREQRDRLASLVGTAYNDDGTIIPALEAAMNQADADAMRHEIGAVVSFLRDNNPNR